MHCTCVHAHIIRMTVGASLTLGQLHTFLHTKWQLGEEGEGGEGVEGGGSNPGGGDNSIQRLKLYHAHCKSHDTIRKQSGLPVQCDTKLDKETSAVSACTRMCALHGVKSQNRVSRTVEVNFPSDVLSDDVCTVATGVNPSRACENEQLSTALRVSMHTSSYSPELAKSRECESTRSEKATDVDASIPIECPNSQSSSENTLDNGMRDRQNSHCKSLTSSRECPELSGCDSCTAHHVSEHVCTCNRQSSVDYSGSPGSSQDYPLRGCLCEVDSNPLCDMSTLHQQVMYMYVHIHVYSVHLPCVYIPTLHIGCTLHMHVPYMYMDMFHM